MSFAFKNKNILHTGANTLPHACDQTPLFLNLVVIIYISVIIEFT